MKERPILFSTEMIQAILDGRKTQTRRLIKPQPKPDMELFGWKLPEYLQIAFGKNTKIDTLHKNRYGEKGDLLWVKETFQIRSQKAIDMGFDQFYYKAGWKGCTDGGWIPSIHMTKAAARIWLQIESVHAERLKDIQSDDAIAEGIEKVYDEHYKDELFKNYSKSASIRKLYNDGGINYYSAKISFKSLWESIHGSGSWHKNPWVWVVKFKTLSTTGRPNLES